MNKREAKRKPVWKVNTGNGVPSDLGGVVVDFSGAIYDSLSHDTLTDKKYWNWYYSVRPVISAYQTTRTREAKYEKVECGYCKASGVLYHEEESNNNLKCYC